MKLIDKDAVVQYLTGMAYAVCCDKNTERIIRKFIIPHINTLEVKEVDLEKLSISEYRIKELIFAFWTGLQTFDTSWYSYADVYSQGIKDILEELGLKAQKGEKV